MQLRTSKALALLGGVATLALGSTFLLRLSGPPKGRPLQGPCAPRLLELERAECTPPRQTAPMAEQLAELSLHAP
jgi:hypothetical protein